MPLARAIRSAVEWVVSAGGSVSVSATTRSATFGPSGENCEGRTDRVIVMEIPVRMRQIRTRTQPGESHNQDSSVRHRPLGGHRTRTHGAIWGNSPTNYTPDFVLRACSAKYKATA
jgi:hypothetical protein